MAKRTRIIEGTWNCTSCDKRDIPARFRSCPACNNPREATGKESEFEFGEVDAASGRSLKEETTDEAALSAAQAGADWFCEFCGASNRGDKKVCRHCRAERSATSQALQADEEPPEPDDRQARRRAQRVAAPPPPPPKPKSRTWMYVVLGLVGSCGALGLWGSRTRTVTGQVTDTEWTRTVYRDTFLRESKDGWRDELRESAPRMPVNGQGESPGVQNIRACSTRQRGTRQVADGTERVCSSKQRQVQCGTEQKCSRQSMGNGFQKEVCNDVPKYCSESYQDCEDRTRYRTEPVYDTSCTYDTFAWKEQDKRTASGHDPAPRWPELPTGALDRLRREENYVIHIAFKDGDAKQKDFEFKTEAEYRAWKKGQSVPLRVNNFGMVELADTSKR